MSLGTDAQAPALAWWDAEELQRQDDRRRAMLDALIAALPRGRGVYDDPSDNALRRMRAKRRDARGRIVRRRP